MDDFDIQLEKLELNEEVKTQLRVEQARLVKIITAFDSLENDKAWHTLKEELFIPALATIERQMRNEVLAKEIDTDKMYRLQGEWAFARQYTNVPEFVETLKKQLASIKQKLK